MSANLSLPRDYTQFLEALAQTQRLEVSECYVSEGKLYFTATKLLGQSPSWLMRGELATLEIRIVLSPFPEWPDLAVEVFDICCIDGKTSPTDHLLGVRMTDIELSFLPARRFLSHYGLGLMSRTASNFQKGSLLWKIRKPRDLAALFEAYDRLAELTGHLALFTIGKDT
jgi:hypothetical protein